MSEQDCLSKNLREKLFILLDDKASKKVFIDMEKYYPGKKGQSAKMKGLMCLPMFGRRSLMPG
jgi:hypothetical protein